MAKLQICRHCDLVVYPSDENGGYENEPDYVELDNGDHMHATCYDVWQEELKKRPEAAKVSEIAKAAKSTE